MQQLSPASAEAGRPNGNPTPTGHSDRRIKTLDGLRGLATIMVIVSHYFAELPHGRLGPTPTNNSRCGRT